MDFRQSPRASPRESVLPNGPIYHPTVRVFRRRRRPEVMLHLRRIGLLNTDVLTVTGKLLAENLDWWEKSGDAPASANCFNNKTAWPRMNHFAPDRAREHGLTGTMIFPRGNLALRVRSKATAIDQISSGRGRCVSRKVRRAFCERKDAMTAIKEGRIKAGDVLVLTGIGPHGEQAWRKPIR